MTEIKNPYVYEKEDISNGNNVKYSYGNRSQSMSDLHNSSRQIDNQKQQITQSPPQIKKVIFPQIPNSRGNTDAKNEGNQLDFIERNNLQQFTKKIKDDSLMAPMVGNNDSFIKNMKSKLHVRLGYY